MDGTSDNICVKFSRAKEVVIISAECKMFGVVHEEFTQITIPSPASMNKLLV